MITESLVGIRECARELGLSHSTVSRQVAAGIIPNRGTVDAPLVLVSEARDARQRELDRSKQRGAASPLFGTGERRSPEHDDSIPAHTPEGRDYQSARADRERTNARLAQLDLEQRLGNVLDKGEVVDAFFTLGASLRELAETRRASMAQRLVAISDVGTIAGIIAEEDRKMQQAIAESFERRFVQADADAAE